MKKVVTCVPGALAASADWNNIQERARGLLAAAQNNDLSGLEGTDGFVHQADASLATATLRLVDDTIDWRDRIVSGWFARVGANDCVGQSTDYNLGDPAATSVALSTFEGEYTGTGAYSATGGSGTAVSNGSPPVWGASGVRSTAIVVDAHGSGYVYLYADPTTGYLYVYNNSGSSLYWVLFVEATSDTGKR